LMNIITVTFLKVGCKKRITSASSRQRFRTRHLYNFNGSRSESAVLFKVVELKKIFNNYWRS